MTNSKPVEDYLQDLESSLSPLPAKDRANILGEIRSHLSERAAQGPSTLASTFAELGDAHQLAQTYLQEFSLSLALSRPTPLWLLTSMLQVGKRNTKAVICVIGSCMFYFFVIAFSIIALMRPFDASSLPGFVGKFGLGGLVRTPHAMEILGWALVPTGAALAIACYLLGTSLLKDTARRMFSRTPVT